MQQQQQSAAGITSELDAPPVTGVGDLVIRALGTGISAALLTCAGAWMLQQPPDMIGKATGVAFLVVTGASGIFLLLSVAERLKARNQYRLMQRKLFAAYTAIRQLEYTVADQRETISRLQAKPAAPQQAPIVAGNRVLKWNITPDTTECATRIINHWFTAGTWYSRRLAKEGGWTQPVHDGAIKLLKDMGIIEQEPGKSPRILPRFTNHGATIAHFNKLCADALTEPDMPARNVVMSNAEDDD